jgi:hypothetical protein
MVQPASTLEWFTRYSPTPYPDASKDFSVVDRSETSSRDPENPAAMHYLWERRLRRVNDGKIRSGKHSKRKKNRGGAVPGKK